MSDSLTGPGTARPQDAAAPEPGTARIPTLWLGLMAGPLSFGIAGPALVLDDIAWDLSTSVSTVTWGVTAFGWGIAVGTPLMAGLLRHRGARAALGASGLLVLLGALLVLTVPLLPAVIIGCALQALGTAGLTSIAMSLTDSARSMGFVTASLAVVGSTSPLVGSLVNDALNWQATLALPAISLIGLLVVIRRVPTRPTSTAAFDGLGAVLLTAVVTALVFVPHYPAVAGVVSVLTIAALVWHLRRRPQGFVPAVVVRSPVFLISSVLALLLAVANFGMMFAVADALSDHTSWSSGRIGAAMVWPMLLGGALSWAVVSLSAKVGRQPVIIVLVALSAAGVVLASVSTVAVLLLLAQALASIAAASGQGVFAVHSTKAVPDEERPAAIGLFNLCYLLGAAFGPAIVSLM
ncbi:MFS transporter [Kitasatospora albolonga]|uniref:MFS transporter n=1 Tax=Kitasatospora albolonga TaxID=68173 RepID=A0ABC8C1U8_9ACTN|nr:MFS transporter [Kitasatospora albolonga]